MVHRVRYTRGTFIGAMALLQAIAGGRCVRFGGKDSGKVSHVIPQLGQDLLVTRFGCRRSTPLHVLMDLSETISDLHLVWIERT